MAKIIKNPKSYIVVEVSLAEIQKFGGLGICDFCNNTSMPQFYICVLNSCYCKGCHDEFIQRAIPYSEDKWYEEKKFDWIKSNVKIENVER